VASFPLVENIHALHDWFVPLMAILTLTPSFKHSAMTVTSMCVMMKDKKKAKKRLFLLHPSINAPHRYGILLLQQSKLNPEKKKPKFVTR
jgi:hypothetical protein